MAGDYNGQKCKFEPATHSHQFNADDNFRHPGSRVRCPLRRQITSTAWVSKSRGRKVSTNTSVIPERNARVILLREAASNRLTTVSRGIYERGNCVCGGIGGFLHTAFTCSKEGLSEPASIDLSSGGRSLSCYRRRLLFLRHCFPKVDYARQFNASHPWAAARMRLGPRRHPVRQ